MTFLYEKLHYTLQNKLYIKKETLLYQRFISKRVTRIELATEAWEASVLPLNYTRTTKTIIIQINRIHKCDLCNQISKIIVVRLLYTFMRFSSFVTILMVTYQLMKFFTIHMVCFM